MRNIFIFLELSGISKDMNKCYEEFSSCMERSAINTANAVFVGDDVSQEYRGYVFIGKCMSLNLIIY